jgi:multiple antibiotic resistance protein
MPNYSQIFTLLFMMLGPFKILGPFVKITRNADSKLARQIAIRAILFSLGTLALAAFLGDILLNKVGIPVPILSLSGGIILFLVSLIGVIKQFEPPTQHEEDGGSPSLQVSMFPLTFPIIITPYGIAAVIVFTTLSTDLKGKLTIGAIMVGIMILNLLMMIFAKILFKPLAIFLTLFGAILGVLTVALGANIIYKSIMALLVI